eukprot:10576129-Alexandrium_andersonii.AAC.1
MARARGPAFPTRSVAVLVALVRRLRARAWRCLAVGFAAELETALASDAELLPELSSELWPDRLWP